MGVLLTNVKSRYLIWREKNENLSDEIKLSAISEIKSWDYQPQFLIICKGMDSFSLSELLRRQWYTCYKYLAAGELSEDIYTYDYIIELNANTSLSENALYEIAKSIQQTQYDLITFDDDCFDRRGRRQAPYFKPNWNPLLQLTSNYIGNFCAARIKKRDFSTSDYLADVIINDVEISHLHIPKVLMHYKSSAFDPYDRQKAHLPQWLEILNEVNKKRKFYINSDGWIEEILPELKERVSIIIPTRDMLSVLKTCVDSVLNKTDYTNYELIIVDNDSVEAETIAYFDEVSSYERVKVIKYPGPFNYSAINNFAVEQCSGDYICLLNNDTEVISENWLTELMKYAGKPKAGAVGPKLLYPDGRIQHAGVIIGQGQLAGHGHRFLQDGEPGYFHRAHQIQQVMAVTAACLVVKKTTFEEVGGLDEKDLTVAFNDVDLCLKINKVGYENIYLPTVKLYHYESISRGKDLSGAKRERYMKEVAIMQSRWKTDTEIDPWYSPNLAIDREDFSIKL